MYEECNLSGNYANTQDTSFMSGGMIRGDRISFAGSRNCPTSINTHYFHLSSTEHTRGEDTTSSCLTVEIYVLLLLATIH